jgi:hypothetical protein
VSFIFNPEKYQKPPTEEREREPVTKRKGKARTLTKWEDYGKVDSMFLNGIDK